MQEQDNDRLEQFFRKAATRADITFNEDDWKKLEARLDAADAGETHSGGAGSKLVRSMIVGSLLIISTAIWFSFQYDITSFSDSAKVVEQRTDISEGGGDESGALPMERREEETTQKAILPEHSDPAAAADDPGVERHNNGTPQIPGFNLKSAEEKPDVGAKLVDRTGSQVIKGQAAAVGSKDKTVNINEIIGTDSKSSDPLRSSAEVKGSEKEQSSHDIAEKNKQKAVVELPGAEEEKTREVEVMIQEEHASDEKKHVASPRLSLLLSFAPDFSGTRMGQYSAPGKAFGAVLHYHFLNKWSISGGVVKNNKRYTGEGTEYHPPKGYWESYTNGVIPETIDGSCSIVEFPIMVQYTFVSNGRSKWNVGAGVSSYLMQTESYQYTFDSPNPGAKDRWDSRNSSRFLFNMLNFTVGYEREVLPGLMLGIEPYAKIPIEKIGWSNLRLFSSGASITMRYYIVGKRPSSIPTRSRGPD